MNGLFHDNGELVEENGEYYIGNFFEGKKQRQGILFYSKLGNIKYEGTFLNDKFEGNGKFYYSNGNYFIGKFKNNKKDGKGIIYYGDGEILYKGDFYNDNYEGFGELED